MAQEDAQPHLQAASVKLADVSSGWHSVSGVSAEFEAKRASVLANLEKGRDAAAQVIEALKVIQVDCQRLIELGQDLRHKSDSGIGALGEANTHLAIASGSIQGYSLLAEALGQAARPEIERIEGAFARAKEDFNRTQTASGETTVAIMDGTTALEGIESEVPSLFEMEPIHNGLALAYTLLQQTPATSNIGELATTAAQAATSCSESLLTVLP